MIRPRDLGDSPQEWLELQAEIDEWTPLQWQMYGEMRKNHQNCVWVSRAMKTTQELMEYDRINWNAPVQVRKTLRQHGISVSDTRRATLERIDHPLARLLLDYRKYLRCVEVDH